MKTISLLPLLLTSCGNMTQAEKDLIKVELIKDGRAAGFAYLTTGSYSAAGIAAGRQALSNIEARTAAKNPISVLP